jgi:predicted methyltransferase
MIAMEDTRIDWGGTLDIEGRLQRNPYGMLAGALAVGFVLGGGLFTRLMAKIVGTGLRMAVMTALPAIQENIIERQQGE